MSVLAICGSPRPGGNTEIIARHTLKAIEEQGLSTEFISVAGLDIRGCNACLACRTGESCPVKDDLLPVYQRMRAAEGIILATPVYFGSASAQIKALMDRAGYIARMNGNAFAGKIGGALVVARRAGHNFTFLQLVAWFTILDMVVPGSSYWTIAFGREKGEVASDREGMDAAYHFGQNMARLIKSSKGN
jgi:multimeric flavodoxin WrbA